MVVKPNIIGFLNAQPWMTSSVLLYPGSRSTKQKSMWNCGSSARLRPKITLLKQAQVSQKWMYITTTSWSWINRRRFRSWMLTWQRVLLATSTLLHKHNISTFRINMLRNVIMTRSVVSADVCWEKVLTHHTTPSAAMSVTRCDLAVIGHSGHLQQRQP